MPARSNKNFVTYEQARDYLAQYGLPLDQPIKSIKDFFQNLVGLESDSQKEYRLAYQKIAIDYTRRYIELKNTKMYFAKPTVTLEGVTSYEDFLTKNFDYRVPKVSELTAMGLKSPQVLFGKTNVKMMGLGAPSGGGGNAPIPLVPTQDPQTLNYLTRADIINLSESYLNLQSFGDLAEAIIATNVNMQRLREQLPSEIGINDAYENLGNMIKQYGSGPNQTLISNKEPINQAYLRLVRAFQAYRRRHPTPSSSSSSSSSSSLPPATETMPKEELKIIRDPLYEEKGRGSNGISKTNIADILFQYLSPSKIISNFKQTEFSSAVDSTMASAIIELFKEYKIPVVKFTSRDKNRTNLAKGGAKILSDKINDMEPPEQKAFLDKLFKILKSTSNPELNNFIGEGIQPGEAPIRSLQPDLEKVSNEARKVFEQAMMKNNAPQAIINQALQWYDEMKITFLQDSARLIGESGGEEKEMAQIRGQKISEFVKLVQSMKMRINKEYGNKVNVLEIFKSFGLLLKDMSQSLIENKSQADLVRDIVNDFKITEMPAIQESLNWVDEGEYRYQDSRSIREASIEMERLSIRASETDAQEVKNIYDELGPVLWRQGRYVIGRDANNRYWLVIGTADGIRVYRGLNLSALILLMLSIGGTIITLTKLLKKDQPPTFPEEISKTVCNLKPYGQLNEGENHAPQMTTNGPVMASYMGPGTHIYCRISRGDKPVSHSDEIARHHDIRYWLSADENSKELQLKKVREADGMMIEELQKALKDGSDYSFNITTALRALQMKKGAEDLNILRQDVFVGDLKRHDPSEIALMKKALSQNWWTGPVPVNPDIQPSQEPPVPPESEPPVPPESEPPVPPESEPNRIPEIDPAEATDLDLLTTKKEQADEDKYWYEYAKQDNFYGLGDVNVNPLSEHNVEEMKLRYRNTEKPKDTPSNSRNLQLAGDKVKMLPTTFQDTMFDDTNANPWGGMFFNPNTLPNDWITSNSLYEPEFGLYSLYDFASQNNTGVQTTTHMSLTPVEAKFVIQNNVGDDEGMMIQVL